MFADQYLRIYIYIVDEKHQNIVDKSKYILLCDYDIATKTSKNYKHGYAM